MERGLEEYIKIIEQEQLTACPANCPKLNFTEKQQAIWLESQDVHALCKLAKAYGIPVILYNEQKLLQGDYYIDKESVLEEYEDVFFLLEADIDEYNMKCQQLDFDNPECITFYFISQGKYFMQVIKCIENHLLKAGEKLHELLDTRLEEIENFRAKEKENRELLEREAEEARQEELQQQKALLDEFLKFVRKDPQFVINKNRRDYVKKLFLYNSKAQKYRDLFFHENDIKCESNLGMDRCCAELEKLTSQMMIEREEYKQTEEYAKKLKEFEELVCSDPAFWEFTFPGHRKDYSYEVFLTDPRAKQYRTLFYAESDVECKDYDGRRDCYYLLERIYKEKTRPMSDAEKPKKHDGNGFWRKVTGK